MKTRALMIGLFALAALAGCKEEPVRSTDVSTLDMLFSLDASDEGNGATVRLRISSPLGDLRLSNGDTLRLGMAGEPLTLRAAEEDDRPVYLAEVEGLSGDITLDLERRADRGIIGRVIPVPPPIGLSAEPLMGDFPLKLTWNGAPEGNHVLGLTVEGTCIKPLIRTLPNDVGQYEISQAELLPADPATPGPCPLQVTLTRNATFQEPIAPPATQVGVYAWFVLSRTVEVNWTP
ncbi:hypothetical protein [Polyangium sp. y55x31]|uniref:hypothetical protein n=1 Tax=Polyangium sp. y55x31 TaxID=3042688 RepID=UPI0024821D0F|nr:hypothetical protein [Polyangium sp. y55x31]MDI1483879.1 hypothetical protein [Polyangium sp. y55x31]